VDPLVSIILPTWNGESDLRKLLPKLAAQRLEGGHEIRAVDSSSRDGTVALLQAAGAHVQVIPKSQFRHGGTRNLCARGARGRYLVFLSQDAEPVDESYLAELTAPFEDERTAGVYARVLPRPDDDPLTRRTVLDLPEAGEVEFSRDLDHVAGLWELESAERVDYLRFNNVSSAVRSDVFRAIPFPDLDFGEDFAWAARALTAGWRIRFAPRARVYHAHTYSARKVFERYRIDAAFHRRVHGHRLRPNGRSALRGFLYEVRADWRFLLRTSPPSRLRSALRSPWLRGAQVLGQYCGSRGSIASDPLVRGALVD
jgi:rhamnosyltransferase